VTALNLYGGSLTMISGIDSIKRVRPTLAVRLITISVTAALSLIAALLSSQSFLTNFNNFLLLILYLFIPWTAVNLIDYYVVRRGHYAVAEIFKPSGIYGRWGWRGVLAYAIGFGAMVPFFSTPAYTGPVANALNGGDISLFIGLPLAGGLYWLFSRSIDVESERKLAEREYEELEQRATEHEAPAATA
jgi:purine-cytosine permease-like protein